MHGLNECHIAPYTDTAIKSHHIDHSLDLVLFYSIDIPAGLCVLINYIMTFPLLLADMCLMDHYCHATPIRHNLRKPFCLAMLVTYWPLGDLNEHMGNNFQNFELEIARFEWNFKQVILQLILMIDGWGSICEIAFIWMSLDLADGKSKLVQMVMAWCHYRCQCWLISNTSYDITRPQWVNILRPRQMDAISQRHFQVHFLELKCLNSD